MAPTRTDSPQRGAWIATITLSLGMLMIPVAFAVVLSAGGEESSSASAPAAASGATRSQSDRSACVTFHLRPGSLGMRILRGAPRETRLVRGRRVWILCGSTSGLIVEEARWPRGKPTMEVELPAAAYATTEFCALKRGRRGVARVVFD